MATDGLSPAAKRVQAALRELGIESRVLELPASTCTAQDAARAIGCRVEQIAKSLVFRQSDSGAPLLVIASGANRVSEALVAAEIGSPIEKADAEFVRAETGFAIGGVPPVGHKRPIPTLLDADLFALETIWAAAGTPHAVFRLTPAQLLQAAGGRVVTITRHQSE